MRVDYDATLQQDRFNQGQHSVVGQAENLLKVQAGGKLRDVFDALPTSLV